MSGIDQFLMLSVGGARDGAENGLGVQGDHAFLIGRHDPDGNGAWSGDRRRGPSVAASLATGSSSTPSQPERRQTRSRTAGDALADAGGEDESVEPAEHRGQPAQLLGDPAHEDGDRPPPLAVGRRRAGRACRWRCRTCRAGRTCCRAVFSTSATVMPRRAIRSSTTPASSAPQRVPMISPSIAV